METINYTESIIDWPLLRGSSIWPRPRLPSFHRRLSAGFFPVPRNHVPSINGLQPRVCPVTRTSIVFFRWWLQRYEYSLACSGSAGRAAKWSVSLQDHAPAQWKRPVLSRCRQLHPFLPGANRHLHNPRPRRRSHANAIPSQFLRSLSAPLRCDVATRGADDNGYKNRANPLKLTGVTSLHGPRGDESILGHIALAPSDPHDAPPAPGSTPVLSCWDSP